MIGFSISWSTFLAVTLILVEAADSRSLSSDDAAKVRQRRMIRGRDANSDEWRFIAFLNFHQQNPKWKMCGGALIDRNWILTAAHCVEDIYNQPDFVSVTVGRVKRTSSSHEDTYKVKKIVIHKGYFHANSANGSTAQTYFNWDYDIALLMLNDSVKHGFVEMAELPMQSLEISETGEVHCKAAGWGSQRQFKNDHEVFNQKYDPPDHLQEIDVPLSTRARCRRQHGKEVSGLVFCGGQLVKDSMTSCIGDSGSPLICSVGPLKKPLLAGIVIGGDYYCQTGSDFMMFTEVAKYRNWIDHHVNC